MRDFRPVVKMGWVLALMLMVVKKVREVVDVVTLWHWIAQEEKHLLAPVLSSPQAPP